MKIIPAMFLIIGNVTAISAQTASKNRSEQPGNKFHELTIGDKVPAPVWKKVPRKKNTRLVILDFWSTGCTSCMEAFPKMETLQKQFDDSLKIVLVNPWEQEADINVRMNRINLNRIRDEMEPYKVLQSLSAINGDTVFRQLFPANTVPHHVWLDTKGTVLYITHGYNATETNVRRVLSGDKIKLAYKRELSIEGFDAWKGILRKGHKAVSPVFYSGFSKYNSGYGGGIGSDVDSLAGTFKRVFINRSVTGLYLDAFRLQRVLLEVENKDDYQQYVMDDNWMERNVFTYEICLPFGNESEWTKYMQEDLNRFFGMQRGIEGVPERRSLNSYVLIKTNDGLLKTSGKESKYVSRNDYVNLVNEPFESVSDFLKQRFEDMNAGRPFLDETGIDPKMKVDFELEGDLADLKNIRSQLGKYGLGIIDAERNVEVLVFRKQKKE